MNINEAQRGAERLIYQKHDAIWPATSAEYIAMHNNLR